MLYGSSEHRSEEGSVVAASSRIELVLFCFQVAEMSLNNGLDGERSSLFCKGLLAGHCLVTVSSDVCLFHPSSWHILEEAGRGVLLVFLGVVSKAHLIYFPL